MKKIIFLFVLSLIVGSIYAQRITYQVTPIAGDYTVVSTDASRNRTPYPSKNYGTLSPSETESLLYALIQEAYTDAGRWLTVSSVKDQEADDLLALAASFGFTGYQAGIDTVYGGSLDGNWTLTSEGDDVFNVTITDDAIFNGATQIGSISFLAEKYIRLTKGGTQVLMGTLNEKVWIGIDDNGLFYSLRK